MRAVRLVVEPYEFINYLKVECVKEINQHSILRITGMVEQQKGMEYMERAARETRVRVNVVSDEGEEKTFFDGVLTGLWIKKENQLHILTMEIRTGSYLLDIIPHNRSFQNRQELYLDVIRECLEASDGHFIMLDKQEMVINKFLLQYQETDWKFMKRLASYMGTVVIPEDETPGKKVYFGYRVKGDMKEILSDSYQVEQNYGGYEQKKAAGMVGITQRDMVSYIVRSREIYGLGEKVYFKGMQFVIGKIVSWLEGQELYHEYRLMTAKGGLLPAIYNHHLSGNSLKANITAVDKTMVQVQIQEDENKKNNQKTWFDYATVYSTPDGTGWYCMPEIGDAVRLVFPDQREENAYVASSIHVTASGGRDNPNEKSWKNKQNKEILFTPDAIRIRNNDGLSIELVDNEGIKIASDKDITMQANGNISLTSQSAGVRMSAGNSLLMQQGAAQLQMKDAINIGGGKIYLN